MTGFGHQMLPFVGKPGPVLNIDDEINQAVSIPIYLPISY